MCCMNSDVLGILNRVMRAVIRLMYGIKLDIEKTLYLMHMLR